MTKTPRGRSSSPRRPRHEFKRTLTDLSSPIRLHRHKPRRGAQDGERDEHLPAAHFPIARQRKHRASLDDWKSDRGPQASRRRSIVFSAGKDNAPFSTVANTLAAPNVREDGLRTDTPFRPQQITFQHALVDLATATATVTARLDDTHAALSSRLSLLHNTSNAVADLARRSLATESAFARESAAFAAEADKALDILTPQFDEQKGRIEALQMRIRQGRDAAQALVRRVDHVKNKVEEWETADGAWQASKRRKLTVVWVVIGIVVSVLLALVMPTEWSHAICCMRTGG